MHMYMSTQSKEGRVCYKYTHGGGQIELFEYTSTSTFGHVALLTLPAWEVVHAGLLRCTRFELVAMIVKAGLVNLPVDRE